MSVEPGTRMTACGHDMVLVAQPTKGAFIISCRDQTVLPLIFEDGIHAKKIPSDQA